WQCGQRTGLAFHFTLGEFFYVVFAYARSALKQTRVQIEHVARISFAAWWTTQQQGNLTISPSLLGQVIINNQGILTAIAEVFTHSTTGEGCQELHRCRIRRSRCDHNGVIHSAVFFQLAHNARYRRRFLTDSYINTLNARTFLVDDGIHSDSGFTDLTVTDDQLTLTAADRYHRIDCFQTDLYWLVYRLTPNYTGCNFFNSVSHFSVQRTL